MKPIAYVLATASIVVTAAAGAAQGFTSPRGFLTAEAPDSLHLFAVLPGQYFHTQIDNTQVGSPRPDMSSLHWRRDGLYPPHFSFGAVTAEVEIRMGHGHWGMVRHGNEHDLQSLATAPLTTVFVAKSVNLPDWTNPPATAPAPFSVHIPFDNRFAYDGQDALLWQARVAAPFGKTGIVDGLSPRPYATVTPSSTGVGCQVTPYLPMTLTSFLYVYGSERSTDWNLRVHSAPSQSDVWLAVGISNPDVDIGACTNMYSSHDFIVPLGNTRTRHEVMRSFRTRHDTSLVGLQLFLQAFAPWSAPVPFAFSQGLMETYAAPPTFSHDCAYGSLIDTYGTWPTSVQLFRGQAVVTGFDDS